MNGDNCNDGSAESRMALGDLTNFSRKRGSSGDLALKSGAVPFSKKLCLVVDDLVREKCGSSDSHNLSLLNDKKSSSDLSADVETDSGSEDVTLVDRKESENVKDMLDVLDVGCQSAEGDTPVEMVAGIGDGLGDSGVLSSSIPTCSEPSKKDCGEECHLPTDVMQIDIVDEGLVTRVLSGNAEGHDELAMGEGETTEGSMLPSSQSSRSFEPSRCSTLKGVEHANHNLGVDLLKSCSCSFCLKVLKKSQKEASVLLQKNSRGRQIDLPGLANSNKSSKLESDLTAQWRSLFLNMGDILGRESNQLQSSFVTLKDLRENCKMDLERSMGRSQDER